ncbi:MAG: pentapeptide repeat-containing protein, partial [Methylococcales bacterium]
MKIPSYWPVFLTVMFCASVSAADLDRQEVEKRLAKADKVNPADLRRKDLTDMDLSDLNFTIADLWGS